MLYVHGISCSHVGTVSYFTTLFLGKPLGGSLPVLSACSFASNLLFLNQRKREMFFHKGMCRMRGSMGSGHASDQATVPGQKNCGEFVNCYMLYKVFMFNPSIF